MAVHIAILEPVPLHEGTEKAQGHYVLEAKFAIQRGGVVIQQPERNEKMKGLKEGEDASKCEENYQSAGDNKLAVTKKIFFRSTEEILEKERIMGKRNNEIIWSPRKDTRKVPLNTKNMTGNVPDGEM